MPQWHPFTKIFAFFGFVIIGTLLWNDKPLRYRDVDVDLHARLQRLQSVPSTQSVNSVDRVDNRQILSSIENFDDILNYPLFNTNRKRVYQKSETQNSILKEPIIRFFGTIEEYGNIIGLIYDGSRMQHLSEGQKIFGWTVSKILPRQLVIEFEGTRVSYQIFDLGHR